MVSKARVTTKRKEGIYGWGKHASKNLEMDSAEQGNISSITQALEEAAFCVPCLLCTEADTASMEFHV